MKLGKRISELREQRQITQGELARVLGVTRAAMSHYENDRRQPDYETLMKLAKYFAVSVEYVIEGRTEQQSIG
ncbi:helix-turn-helix transcriptional regulator [Paenibacillus sp. GD4]|jgi:transcriptional regulator with XRE-family HTH domain|uniref:helix-turn-helix transcriptional regulator n=1 Tax=Paenibacillus TaxID=44249 RepID=UPI0025433530|nr:MULTISPECIES: helix-turn-helix transcriptional regulator [Paenibacillus]MDQ1910424.1 helix-turn-helix transcriptional regulator [Paenibacillus sp. GD4]